MSSIPSSPQGLEAYDFALQDSLSLTAGARTVQVYEVDVRPKSFSQPLVIGTLYLDVATAEVVQFRFSFTPSAYLDPELEDISIVLENALYEGRYWLPERQQIEIRRRTTWLDFPARGIIQGRWEIGEYDLNAPFPAALYAAPAIGGLRQPKPDSTEWRESLERRWPAWRIPVNRTGYDGAPAPGRGDRRQSGAQRTARHPHRLELDQRTGPCEPGAGTHARVRADAAGGRAPDRPASLRSLWHQRWPACLVGWWWISAWALRR